MLKRGNELIKSKLHPTSIISGYKIAAREACKYIEEHLTANVKDLGKTALMNAAKTSPAAKTSLSSKIIGM